MVELSTVSSFFKNRLIVHPSEPYDQILAWHLGDGKHFRGPAWPSPGGGQATSARAQPVEAMDSVGCKSLPQHQRGRALSEAALSGVL